MPYRLVVLPKRIAQTRWLDRRDDVVTAAIELGLAERDEHVPENVYWHPLAEIEDKD